MTRIWPSAKTKTLGFRKSATRSGLAIFVAAAAVCGSGYQSSVTGVPRELTAAAARTVLSTEAPTGWVGRELLALQTPPNRDFLVPGEPLDLSFVGPVTEAAPEFDAAEFEAPGDTPDDGVQVTSVSTDGPDRPGPGTLMSPLEALSPSSPFGERINPITGEADEFHYGLDFAASCGTPVHAADAGTVRAVGWHPWGGGNRVEIDHGNGLITTYNHLEGISVKAGDTIAVSQIVAAVGTTGSSTGCHLHFETIRDGSHVDPKGWTLTPLRLSATERTPDMTSYAPGGAESANSVPWVIAMPHDGSYDDENGRSGDPGPTIMAAQALPAPTDHSANPRAIPKRPAGESAPATPKAPVIPRPSATPKPSPAPDAAKPDKKGNPTPSPSPSPSSSASYAAPGGHLTPPPAPTPRPSPKPDPSAEPTPEPDSTPSPKPSPEPTPDPSPSPEPAPSPKPSPKPSPEPTPDPSPSPEPAPSPKPSPKPSPEPTPDPSPDPSPNPEPTPGCDVGPKPVADPGAAIGLGLVGKTGLEAVNSRNVSPLPAQIPHPVLNTEASAHGARADISVDGENVGSPTDQESPDPKPGCEGEEGPTQPLSSEPAYEPEDTGPPSQDAAATPDPAKP
ncbi:M23 family metallopeptidase [Arthrobacter sp. Hz1]